MPDLEPVVETMPDLEPVAETMPDLEPVAETRPEPEPVAETMPDLEPVVETRPEPAPVSQWLARRTVGRKVWGSNPIRVMWDFSALAGSYPELGVLWAQWEGWNHTAELLPLHGCIFEGVALIT